MFDPFFTTKAPGKGTGLGLATVLGLVRTYDGFLQVFSEIGRGTQIKVYLPVLETPKTADKHPADAPAVELNGNGELILIVEDDEMVQTALQSLLENHHYTTLVANDGADAIEQYMQHQNEIRLVISDVMMPNIDGITLIQTLKAYNAQVNVIALSGLPSHHTAALEAGAQVFLVKPYALETLLQTVWDLIHPPEPQEASGS
jgi:hypothetical protein